MIMKEGNRRSDEQMFEAVDFDLLVRKALGLVNLTDQAPSLDTYYLLRRRIVPYWCMHSAIRMLYAAIVEVLVVG